MKPVVVSVLTLVLLTTLALAATAFVEILGKKRGRHVAVSRAHRRALLTIAVAALGSAAVALVALTGAETWGSTLVQPAGAVLASALMMVALRHVQRYVRMLMGIRSGGRKAVRLRQRLGLLRSVLVRPALVFGVFFAALAVSGFTGEGVWPGRPPTGGNSGEQAGSPVDRGTLDGSNSRLTSYGFAQSLGMRPANATADAFAGPAATTRDGGTSTEGRTSTAASGGSDTGGTSGSGGGSDTTSAGSTSTPVTSDPTPTTSPSDPPTATSDPVKQVTQTVEQVTDTVDQVVTDPVQTVTDPVTQVTESVAPVTDPVDQVTGDVTGTVGSLLP